MGEVEKGGVETGGGACIQSSSRHGGESLQPYTVEKPLADVEDIDRKYVVITETATLEHNTVQRLSQLDKQLVKAMIHRQSMILLLVQLPVHLANHLCLCCAKI